MKAKTKKVKSVKKTPLPVIRKKEPEQRWTQGYSTMDGQPANGAWFNVTNWH